MTLETQIWSADNLVIVNPEDGIVYARTSGIEFDPATEDESKGVVRAMVPSKAGWFPSLTFDYRMDEPNDAYPGLRHRGGVTLVGVDPEGYQFTWYFAVAADRYLTYNAEPPEEPEEVSSVGDEFQGWERFRSGPHGEHRMPAQPLSVVDNIGFCSFSGVSAILMRPTGEQRPLYYASALSPNEDGEKPEIFVLSEEIVHDGRILHGVDGGGKPVDWYIGEAVSRLDV